MPGLAPFTFFVPPEQIPVPNLFSQSFTATLLQAGSAGIGTQVATDNFNRANENPLISPPWTHYESVGAVNALRIVGNSVTNGTGGADDGAAWYNLWSSGNDQYSQAASTASGTGAGSGYGVTVRDTSPGGITAAQNCYRLVVDGVGNYELARFLSGTFASLRTGTVSYSSGALIGLSVQGSGTSTTLKIWYAGVQIGTNVVDSGGSAINSGSPGIAYSSAISGTLDNWDAGTTGGAPVTAFTKLPQKKLSATGSFVGALGNRTLKALTATLSFVGNLAKQSTRALSATLSFVGAVSRNIPKAFSATLSFVGTFSKSFISGGGTLFTQSLTATLSFVGAVAKLPKKSFKATAFYFSSVFTDSFTRANGSLGANWTSPVGSFGTGLTGAEGTLHIVSNQVATVTDDTHCYALWNGAFGDDQYAQIKVDQLGAWTGAVVRCTYGVDRFYFAFSFAANDYRIYQRWDGAYVSLTPETAVTWSAGDILRLEISGSTHPFSLRMYRNGALVAQWTSPDSTYELTGGSPGMGIYSPTGLNLTLDDWEGGNYSPLHVSDSFNRADGALGSNWTATVASQTTIVVSSNKAGVSAHDLHAAYFWSANTFADDQYAQFRWFNSLGAAYTGAILRADASNDQYYLGLVNSSALVTLYARWSGSYVSLATATPALTDNDMIRLEVTGSVHPITITMYQNGNPILSWTSPNSTNVRAGGNPGMGIYSPTGSTLVLDDWEGGNLRSTTPTTLVTLSLRTSHLLSATLSFIGATTKAIRDAGFSAALSFIGALAKRTTRFLTATLSFVGAMTTATVHRFTQAFTATLSFIGSFSEKNVLTRFFTATLSASAVLSKSTGKALSATLSASASLVRRITRTLSATLSFTGSMVKAIRNAGFSSISFVGNLATGAVHFFTRSFAATLSFVGNLTSGRLIQRIFAATLSFSATLRGKTAKVFAATLGFSGQFGKFLRKVFSATLHFTVFLFRGGAVTIIAGWITKCLATIGISGSTPSIPRTGSQLTVQKTGGASQVTGSQLSVERKK